MPNRTDKQRRQKETGEDSDQQGKIQKTEKEGQGQTVPNRVRQTGRGKDKQCQTDIDREIERPWH